VEQGNDNGNAVKVDIQKENVLMEIYENDSKWSCFIQNISLIHTSNSKSTESINSNIMFCSRLSSKQINFRPMSSNPACNPT
jgi:hypothetical protein